MGAPGVMDAQHGLPRCGEGGGSGRLGLGRNLGLLRHDFLLRIGWQKGPLFLLRTIHHCSGLN